MRWNLLNISHARACLTVVLCIFVTTSECILDFPQTPGVVYSPVNEDVSIPCALSFPADETLELLMWYHDGVWILHTGTDLNVKFSDTVPSGKFRLVDDTYTLQIRSVYKEDTGNYTCKKSYKAQVDGSLKFVEKNVTTELIVQDVPSPPGAVKVNDVQSRECVVSWQESLNDNNSPITHYIINDKVYNNGIPEGYIVEYKKVNEIEVRAFTIEGAATTSALIENLTPFTNYSVKILMFNDIDNGPAAEVFVMTSEGVPAKPRISHLSDRQSTSFVVNWEAPMEYNGILKNYQLQWIHNNTYKTRIITGHLTQPMRALISNLEPYTSYQLRVRAETGGGYSDYSDLYPALTDVKDPTMMTATKPETSQAGMIAGIIVGFTIMIIIVAVVIGYKSMTCRKYTRSLYYLAVPTNSQSPQTTVVFPPDTVEWPDHGVPEFTLPVLKFIQKSSSDNPPGAGPIVIHCSAGVGRTGTYILIESMIKQILDRGTINIPAFLLHIRQQRKSLVQTEEQYMLIHDAIAEWILTQGDPEIKESDLTKQLARLTRQVNGEIPPIDIQYNLVTSFSPQPDDMFHALKPVNLCKNRDLKYVPLSDDYILMTRIVTWNDDWPESCSPLHQVFDFVDEVQTLHKHNDMGPVIVVDSSSRIVYVTVHVKKNPNAAKVFGLKPFISSSSVYKRDIIE
ncbi:PTPRG-like protein, partial [Mya arenaria]